jgi:hypothetical protein
MGAPYFFEILGLLVIYLRNMPNYIYRFIRAALRNKPVPSYKYIFHIPKNLDKPIYVRLIGFGVIVFVIMISVASTVVH